MQLKPEKELNIFTLKAAKKLNEAHKITAYLQQIGGDPILKGVADAFALEYQFSF